MAIGKLSMGNVFGKDVPLKDVLRENKREINKAIRELEREKITLEREEKKLTIEIKKAAKDNQMSAVKIMAKDLVRTRQHQAKFIEMRSHLQGCALKLQTVKSHQAMADALSNTAKAMSKMNKIINVPTITKMMSEFERENAKAEMMSEMMSDAIDDALADDNNEEEEDKIVSQVLDEIGISFGDALPEASNMSIHNTNTQVSSSPSKIAQPMATGGGGGGIGADDDPALSELEARLNNLKK